MLDFKNMTTEMPNEKTAELDSMGPLSIVTVMNEEDEKVVRAVKEVLPQVAQAVDLAAQALRTGGRLIYVGAGTSGRLGVLDSAECPPTFGVPEGMVCGVIAGGEDAILHAVEGAEDSRDMGEADMRGIGLTDKDFVIGIAASGNTPYVSAALEYARCIGCKTAAISCNRSAAITRQAELVIEPIVGPEVIAGSTRLKAGTAQKMILNMISTGAMVQIGKVYKNLMVDVVQSNEKLSVRAENIVILATGAERGTARKILKEADGSAKTAIVMILTDCGAEAARDKLNEANGHIRRVLQK